jgi:hypothetical protein
MRSLRFYEHISTVVTLWSYNVVTVKAISSELSVHLERNIAGEQRKVKIKPCDGFRLGPSVTFRTSNYLMSWGQQDYRIKPCRR